LRWVLLGSERPKASRRGGLLLGYGAVAWVFSLVFLTLTIAGSQSISGRRRRCSGWLDGPARVGQHAAVVPGFFPGRGEGDDSETSRTGGHLAPGRGLGGAGAGGLPDRRPRGRDVPAPPVGPRRGPRSGRRLPPRGRGRRGEWISVGQRVARLEVPDLESKLAQAQAERRESASKLRLLEVGPRPEKVEEQRLRVGRTRVWRDLARNDLERTRQALKAELAEIGGQVRQFRAEVERATGRWNAIACCLTARRSRRTGSTRPRRPRRSPPLSSARPSPAARPRGRGGAEGRVRAGPTRDESAEKRPRSDSLKPARGPRRSTPRRPGTPGSRRRSASSKVSKLGWTSIRRCRGSSPPRGSGNGIGQYFATGELIAEVESPARVEAEWPSPSRTWRRVKPGQSVALKVRALPFQTFSTRVARSPRSPSAPAARRATRCLTLSPPRIGRRDRHVHRLLRAARPRPYSEDRDDRLRPHPARSDPARQFPRAAYPPPDPDRVLV